MLSCGPWAVRGVATQGGFGWFCINYSWLQCYLFPVAVSGRRLFSHMLLLLSSNSQSWGHKLRRVQWPSCLTRAKACSANGTIVANGTCFVFSVWNRTCIYLQGVACTCCNFLLLCDLYPIADYHCRKRYIHTHLYAYKQPENIFEIDKVVLFTLYKNEDLLGVIG